VLGSYTPPPLRNTIPDGKPLTLPLSAKFRCPLFSRLAEAAALGVAETPVGVVVRSPHAAAMTIMVVNEATERMRLIMFSKE
jgi:hypothetical protein